MPLDLRRVLYVVVGLIIVGVGLWLVNNYVPMAASIRDILNIVVVIATCVGVLQGLGLWPAVVRAWNDLTRRRIVQ